MSGFTTDWLALREPADRAARSPDLLRAAALSVSDRERPLAVDLGCGTGSTMRAMMPHLPAHTRWRLVDNDPSLLAEAGRRASGTDVDCVAADLSRIDGLPVGDADIVTASALFDLVSREWVEHFVATLASGGATLYAALSYDGRIAFEAVHPMDKAVCASFDRHQAGDKGFGPALGPNAGAVLAQALVGAGFSVRTADSPWRLDPGPLQAVFVDGLLDAVRETGDIPPDDLDDWARFRVGEGGRGSCLVGHIDVLASR